MRRAAVIGHYARCVRATMALEVVENHRHYQLHFGVEASSWARTQNSKVELLELVAVNALCKRAVRKVGCHSLGYDLLHVGA